MEERIHKHIATKRIWPKEQTNPLAGGDGWQPRQKVHFNNNAFQRSEEGKGTAAGPVSLPQLASPANKTASKPPATASGASSSSSAASTSNALPPKPATAAASTSAIAATATAVGTAAAAPATASTKDVIRVGIVPGLDSVNERKTGLRVVKPMPAVIKNIVKNVRPQKMSDPNASVSPAGKRVFKGRNNTFSEEHTIESLVGHKHRGYTTEEKRNGIGAGGDRGFATVEFSERFFETGATVAPLKWSPTKHQKAELKRQQILTAHNGSPAAAAAAAAASPTGAPLSAMSRTASSTNAQRLLGSVSPSKAQKARAAAEQAAVQAILTRKTFKQKLEEEARAADIVSVSQLPDKPLTSKDRENPNAAANGSISDDD